MGEKEQAHKGSLIKIESLVKLMDVEINNYFFGGIRQNLIIKTCITNR